MKCGVPHWRERKKFFWCIFNDLSCDSQKYAWEHAQDCLSLKMVELFGIEREPDYCTRLNSVYSKLCQGCKSLKEGKEPKGKNFFTFFVRIKSADSWRTFNENHRCHFRHMKQGWCRHVREDNSIYCERHRLMSYRETTIRYPFSRLTTVEYLGNVTAGMFYTSLLCLKKRGIPSDLLKFVIAPILTTTQSNSRLTKEVKFPYQPE